MARHVDDEVPETDEQKIRLNQWMKERGYPIVDTLVRIGIVQDHAYAERLIRHAWLVQEITCQALESGDGYVVASLRSKVLRHVKGKLGEPER